MDPITVGMTCYKLGKFGVDLWYGTHADKIVEAIGFIDDYTQSHNELALKKACSILEDIPSNEKDYIIAGKYYYLSICYVYQGLVEAAYRYLDEIEEIEVGSFTARADLLNDLKGEAQKFRYAISKLDQDVEIKPVFEDFEECLESFQAIDYQNDVDDFLSKTQNFIDKSNSEEDISNANILCALVCLKNILGSFHPEYMSGVIQRSIKINVFLRSGVKYINNAHSIDDTSEEIIIIQNCLLALEDFWHGKVFSSKYYDSKYIRKCKQIIKGIECFTTTEEIVVEMYEQTFEHILYFCTPDGNENDIDSEIKKELNEACDDEDDNDDENDYEDEITNKNELTEGETEYLNELKEILSEGEISDRDQRFLNKIRQSNGISDQRAKELEKLASAPILSEEEKEYLNEFREIIADGEISARDRRYLEKIKHTNNINDERAKELESMA